MNFEKGGVYLERPESLPPARFLMLPVKDTPASTKAGHDIYIDKPYIEIMKQGGAIQQFAVNDEWKGRYHKKWTSFEQGLEEPKTGLPLEKWPGCTRSECENLKRVNIFTVEELAKISDIGFESYGMGGRALKNKAEKYLEAAQDNGAVVARLEDLEKKFEASLSTNEDLKKQLQDADIALQIAQKEEPEQKTLTLTNNGKKRGRPKKQ